MSSSVDFYYMPESPPCRTVELVAAIGNIKINKHHVNLFLGEHMKEEYLKLNPWHKVPFIKDGDLKLNESRAICQYLCNKYLPADNALYPQDPIKRAKIDELLMWDIGTLYSSLSKLFYPKIRTPGAPPNADNEKAYGDVLKAMDETILSHGKKFLLGDQFNIADIIVACGFSLAEACEFDISQFKNVSKWLKTCKDEIPHFREINDGPTANMKKHIENLAAKAAAEKA